VGSSARNRHLVVELGEAVGLGGVAADEVLSARAERRGLAYRAVERRVDVGDVGAGPGELGADLGIGPESRPPQRVLHRAARDPAGADAEHDGGHQDHHNEEGEGDGIFWR
jgi:hypothetical protein